MPKNAKLAYEAKEPAFLQKLRGHYGDNAGRLERPAARPRRLKNQDEEDDDAPVYVDETNNEVISKADYDALVNGGPNGKTDETSATSETAKISEIGAQSPAKSTVSRQQNNLLEIGGSKKRKQAKLVGDHEQEQPALEQAELPAVKSKEGNRKPKKAKKIKLSFDQDE